MLVECHHDGLQPALASLCYQTANHKLMTAVHSVEKAYSGNASVHSSMVWFR